MLDLAIVALGVLQHIVRVSAMGVPQLIASVLLFAYAAVTWFWTGRPSTAQRIKLCLLLLLIASTVGWRTADLISQRSRFGDTSAYVHDHILQNESSVQFLLHSQNPYSADFRRTPLISWWKDNPALDHVIALPVTFYKSFPFSLAWEHFFGWYDDRISHLALLILAVVSLYFIPTKPELKLAAIALFVLNPLFTPFFEEGRSDVIFLSFLFGALALLRHRHVRSSLLLLALAVGSKHTAVFIVPFFLAYLTAHGVFARQWWKTVLPAVMVLSAIFLPFVLWDFGAFMDDVYHYPAGTLPTSYPINGFGLSMALVNLGAIRDIHAYFPMSLFLIVLLPLFYWLLRDVLRRPTISRMLVAYAALLWPYWFFARFFNDNYLGVVVLLVALGAVMHYDELPAPQQVKATS